MPSSARTTARDSPVREDHCSYGQVIEYIRDRLYLASYTHPPNGNTPFPYPSRQSSSPQKRGARPHNPSTTPVSNAPPRAPVYFSVDKILLYNAFHADFGPLHIGHLYRFAIQLHEILADPEHEQKAVVFWSHADSRSRANAACVLACYMVLVQSWPAHLALAPIAQMDPPLMPFRDAGYSQADYILTIQDVVYGLWRAKEAQLCGLEEFNLEEYERYERVDMGDFNWVTPNFVAFASPQHQPIDVIPTSSPDYASLPSNTKAVYDSNLPQPFKMVLGHFRSRKVGLVVRLNSELYSPSYFTALGIKHLDMIFEDGTCPPLALVRKFIKLAHEMITVRRRQVAVHCKAGLGRTGCLIGAYLIYRHGFTANEVIAYMRFMRPGMVVGPQQHWLHLNQGSFREWWFEDAMKDKMALLSRATPPPASTTTKSRLASNGQTHTPPNGTSKRRALGELEEYATNVKDSTGSIGVHDDNLPAPTPGQPRKTSKTYGERHNPFLDNENVVQVDPDTEIVSMSRHVAHHDENRVSGIGSESESEEEYQLRVLATKRTSPGLYGIVKQRAVTCSVTTLGVTGSNYPGGVIPSKSPIRKISGNGIGSIHIGKRDSPKRAAPKDGVRKTSGRVGSTGAVASMTRLKQ